MAERLPQSTTIRVPIQAYLASDHVSAATGKTIAITISKNGAAYGNPSAGATNATEISNGSYYVDLSTTDTATVGPLFVRGAVATIDDVITIYNVFNDSAIKKNKALANFEFLMTDSSAHNPVTGKTVTVTRSIDRAAFAAGSLSAVTEVSNGIYSVDFAAADLNGTVITLRCTASGCDDLLITIIPVP